jgi:predicted GNAT family acetyltransferase
MEDVIFEVNERGRGSFSISEGDKQIGKMDIGISGEFLTAYHTEVAPEAEGKGLAKKLLEAMVAYAREQKLKVIPLCVFVQARFKRHPEQYADIWQK